LKILGLLNHHGCRFGDRRGRDRERGAGRGGRGHQRSALGLLKYPRVRGVRKIAHRDQARFVRKAARPAAHERGRHAGPGLLRAVRAVRIGRCRRAVGSEPYRCSLPPGSAKRAGSASGFASFECVRLAYMLRMSQAPLVCAPAAPAHGPVAEAVRKFQAYQDNFPTTVNLWQHDPGATSAMTKTSTAASSVASRTSSTSAYGGGPPAGLTPPARCSPRTARELVVHCMVADGGRARGGHEPH
jgi:hypothetical protein